MIVGPQIIMKGVAYTEALVYKYFIIQQDMNVQQTIITDLAISDCHWNSYFYAKYWSCNNALKIECALFLFIVFSICHKLLPTIYNVSVNILPIMRKYTHSYSPLLKGTYPDSKVHEASTGPTWVLSAPDGPHVSPMNLAIRVVIAGWNRINKLTHMGDMFH